MWAVVYTFIPICLKCIFRACFLYRWVARMSGQSGRRFETTIYFELGSVCDVAMWL
jgi:hypothetical protein